MEALELEQVLAAYLRTSSANKEKFSKLRVVLQQFHAHGIDCILLKGADLIPRLYGVLGARPMVDVDLLVRELDLKYRYGDKSNVHPLETRLSRPFFLLFQAVMLFIRIVRLQITRRF